jgi:hypothetical protein
MLDGGQWPAIAAIMDRNYFSEADTEPFTTPYGG